MTEQEVEEIIACLSHERTLFPYFRDRYALMLLAHATQAHHQIRELRDGPFARLLEKPIVKLLLADAGNGELNSAALQAYWPYQDVHDFVLCISKWGHPREPGFNQASRRGYNLVLQLNFNGGHMQKFARLVKNPTLYNYDSHPCSRKGDRYHRETLAWARLDVSLETDEVLIEEIQSDFVRTVRWNAWIHDDHNAVMSFCAPFQKIWHEAMLTATVDFCWRELGVSNIYYHDFKTGCALKQVAFGEPPRSLYNALPKQFCMTRTAQAPELLRQHGYARRVLKRLKDASFFTYSG